MPSQPSRQASRKTIAASPSKCSLTTRDECERRSNFISARLRASKSLWRQLLRQYLRGLPGCNGKIGVIGYCSGGRQSFLAACSLPFQAAVDCYGAAVVHVPEQAPATMKPIVGLSKDLNCPLLGLFGADDQFPPPAETAELSEVLDSFGKPHEFHTFEGAGHAFFAPDRPSYRVDAATQGWALIWEFFGKHLA